MLKKYLVLILLLVSGLSYAQVTYPVYNVNEIQKDTTLVGDTVTVIGIVMVAPANENHKPIMWAGGRWQTYLRDTSLVEDFGGLNIVQDDTTTAATLIDLIDTAQIVKITGVVTEYLAKNTQINVLRPVATEIVGAIEKRPEPVEVEISEFVNAGAPILDAEKYEGLYVIFKNVTTTARDARSGGATNPFSIMDGNGNTIVVHGQSGYFTQRSHKLRTWEPPVDGSVLPYIRGVIGQNSDGSFVFRPMYPNDIMIGEAPPVISSIRRSAVTPAPNTAVDINAKIVDLDAAGAVFNARLYYRINGGTLTSLNMTKTTDSTVWTAQIPGVSGDSALVDYFIWAQDNSGMSTVNPVDTAKNRFFYLVLNRPITIQDAQYAPFPSGYSAYNGYRVTLTGIVTADTSDLQGDGNQISRRVHIQNGTGPWSGIQVGGLLADQLRRGQNVTITDALVIESNSVTRIDSTTTFVVNSENNPLPAPVVLSTSTVAAKANGSADVEPYESVLVTYNNVTVTDDNSDGNSGVQTNNYGEISVADTSNVSTRVELQEGNHIYHNLWDSVLVKEGNPQYIPGGKQIKEGDKLSSLTGVLYFSFSNYKLVPRKSDDFVGHTPLSVNNDELVAESYTLNQNYPNPFNPVTTISYSIPANGLVTIRVYDILGKEVKTLLNQDQNAGSYKVVFDATSLTSGVYFYQIKTANFTSTKKMVLMK